MLLPFASPAALLAEPTKVVWDAGRATSPDTVDELRALQDRVKDVTAKVMPTTVGLFIGQGAGSGVIVSDAGLVLTAAHVIGRPGETVRVILPDGTRVNGTSLGLNSKIDSGMVQLESPPKDAKWPGVAAGKWPVATLGKSADLKKGQWLIALGHHGGPRRDRTPPLRLGRFEYFNKAEKTLRSDCTLVGGDSGGPLFDLDGKLVGIHSKIGLFIEYNMHVAIDAFQPDWEKLVAGANIGKPEAELGVALDSDLTVPTILSVTKDSPAQKAGLQKDDVILKFNSEKILTRSDLKATLQRSRPGQRVTLTVQRDDEEVVVKLVLSRKPDPE